MTDAALEGDARVMMHRRQLGNCFYCWKPLDRRFMVSDHLIPRWVGGRHHHYNRVAAHMKCDGAKGGRMPTDDELALQAALIIAEEGV